MSIINLDDDHNKVTTLFDKDELLSKEPIVCFCYHPIKEEIVVATAKGLLSHWNLEGTECYRSFKAHQMPIVTMCYDPTGTLLSTGSTDRSVRVWDVAGGFCTHSFREHTDIVQLVIFHPDPYKLILFSCSDDNLINIYDLKTSKCISKLNTHISLPTSISFETEESYLMASCGRDKV